ncbi:MAG: GTP-binding protein [Candidatus Marsarchaeota archaeon]|nr:GTP-binding protein [Candidatus Marsarchaeota archaeon]MCL5106378.1 GTP-binding protein [Candidatus Marsarchaeota archaeon]
MKKYRIVMLGEKDHGKSTLLANLLIASNSISDERINEVRAVSKKSKTRFEPAYILDAFSEERSRGMTIDTTRADITYKNSIYELIDVPGHLELIKNMMTGASDSEMAVLVVSAKKGEGFKPETKRHLFIAMMFNVKAIVVVVNKLDESGYSRKAFEKIKDQVLNYIKEINPRITAIAIPISAYNNENLISKSENIKWNNGKSLMETINGLKNSIKSDAKNNGAYKKEKEARIRILVQDVMQHSGQMAFGIAYSGSIKKKDRIRILPENATAVIKSVSSTNAQESSGMQKIKNLSIRFDRKLGIKRGDIIYDMHSAPAYTRKFRAEIFAINAVDLSKDLEKIRIVLNNNDRNIKGMKVLRAMSPITGKKISVISKKIKPNTCVDADIILNSAYPMEKFSVFENLGRFLVFVGNRFSGIGKIK